MWLVGADSFATKQFIQFLKIILYFEFFTVKDKVSRLNPRLTISYTSSDSFISMEQRF